MYSSSIRVVEKSHSEEAMARRIVSSQALGRPRSSRSYQRGTISFSRMRYRSCASAQSWAPSSGFVSRPPMAQPFSPCQPSSHQPSSTEQLTTPFMAAFMPLVPEASSGRRGLLSQTSTPETR